MGLEPKRKPNFGTTVHWDGTVSLWNVYTQTWQRTPIMAVPDEVLASLSAQDRRRILIGRKRWER